MWFDFFSLALIVLLVWVVIDGFLHFRKVGRLDFYVLVALFFCLFYPVSGVSHFMFNDSAYRGFYDSVEHLSEKDFFNVNFYAVFSLYIGYFSWKSGTGFFGGYRSFSASDPVVGVVSRRPLAILGWSSIVFSVIGFAAFLALLGQVDLTEVDRSRKLASGSAKFAFLSSWFCWGATFLYLWVHFKFRRISVYASSLFFLLVVMLCVANVFWTGGRSIALLVVMPLIMHVVRMRGKKSILYMAPFSVFLLAYVVWMTLARTEGYSTYEVTLSGFLDWEFGRYSMVAYAIDYVDRSGYLFGLTFLYAILGLLVSPLYLIGLAPDWLAGFSSVTELVGSDLFGDSSMTYVVPGLVSESYMNLGMLGVGLAMFGVGTLTRFVDKGFSESAGRNPLKSVFYAYLGTLLCLNLMNSTLFAFINYIFFTGFPLLLMFCVGVYIERKKVGK